MILLMILTSLSYADPTAITIEKGKPAPYSGTLLNAEAIAEMITAQDSLKQRCEIEKDLAVKTSSAKLISKADILESRVTSCETNLRDLSERNVELVRKYNTSLALRPYIASLGFIGGVVATVLIASALNGVVQ